MLGDEKGDLAWTQQARIQAVSSFGSKILARELYRIQEGNQPTDWKPMAIVGPGVIEIRVHRPHEYRVVYIANYEGAIYVLHAFQKQAQQVPVSQIEVARTNYAKLQKARRE